MNAYLDSLCPSKFGEEVFAAVDCWLRHTEPDEGVLQICSSAVRYLTRVYDYYNCKLYYSHTEHFIELLSLVLGKLVLAERCKELYHQLLGNAYSLILKTQGQELPGDFFMKWFPSLLKLCVKGGVDHVCKRRLLRLCTRMLRQARTWDRNLVQDHVTHTLNELSESWVSFADYFQQLFAITLLFEFSATSPAIKNSVVARMKQHAEKFLQITPGNFHLICRMLLNEVNSSEEKKVISLPCHKALVGNEMLKPHEDAGDVFWVDFNFGTGKISFICDSITFTNEQLSPKKLLYMSVDRKTVLYYNFRRLPTADDLCCVTLSLSASSVCRELVSVPRDTSNVYLKLLFQESAVCGCTWVDMSLHAFFCLEEGADAQRGKETSSQECRDDVGGVLGADPPGPPSSPNVVKGEDRGGITPPLRAATSSSSSGEDDTVETSSAVDISMESEINLARFVRHGYDYKKPLVFPSVGHSVDDTFDHLLNQGTRK